MSTDPGDEVVVLAAIDHDEEAVCDHPDEVAVDEVELGLRTYLAVDDTDDESNGLEDER